MLRGTYCINVDQANHNSFVQLGRNHLLLTATVTPMREKIDKAFIASVIHTILCLTFS